MRVLLKTGKCVARSVQVRNVKFMPDNWEKMTKKLSERLDEDRINPITDSEMKNSLTNAYYSRDPTEWLYKRYLRMPYLGVASGDLQAVFSMLYAASLTQKHLGNVPGLDRPGSDVFLRGVAPLFVPQNTGTVEQFCKWLESAFSLHAEFKKTGQVHTYWTLGPRTRKIMSAFDSLSSENIDHLKRRDIPHLIAFYIRLCGVYQEHEIPTKPISPEELKRASEFNVHTDVIVEHSAELHSSRVANKVEASTYLYLDEAGFPGHISQFSGNQLSSRYKVLTTIGNFIDSVKLGTAKVYNNDTQTVIDALQKLSFKLTASRREALAFKIFNRVCDHIVGTAPIESGEVIENTSKPLHSTRNFPRLDFLRNPKAREIVDNPGLLGYEKEGALMIEGFPGNRHQMDQESHIGSKTLSVAQVRRAFETILANKGEPNPKKEYHREAEIYEALVKLGVTGREMRLKSGGLYLQILIYRRICKVLRGYPILPGEKLGITDEYNARVLSQAPTHRVIFMPSIGENLPMKGILTEESEGSTVPGRIKLMVIKGIGCSFTDIYRIQANGDANSRMSDYVTECARAQVFIQRVITFFIEHPFDPDLDEEQPCYTLGPYEDVIVSIVREWYQERQQDVEITPSEYHELLTYIQEQVAMIGARVIPHYIYNGKQLMTPPVLGTFTKSWKQHMAGKYSEPFVQRNLQNSNMLGSPEQINQQMYPVGPIPTEGTIDDFRKWLSQYYTRIHTVEKVFQEYTVGSPERCEVLENLFKEVPFFDEQWIAEATIEELTDLHKKVAAIFCTLNKSDTKRTRAEAERQLRRSKRATKYSRRSYADVIISETGAAMSTSPNQFLTKYIARKLNEVYKARTVEGRPQVGILNPAGSPVVDQEVDQEKKVLEN
eukprot:TRINITY_DN2899_c0_g1_i1.p1 TRINITY_DN2899_c0_g1~~TRINITY_DN2899_c0_g1_i1.p1  ORF type:complete len:889 (+),score=88.18 TRINITY_DN2899_c0_g1_i1:44-2710(+)